MDADYRSAVMYDMGPIAREEYELVQTDNKYRLYVGAIDRALKIFESTTEWADLIAALGKLNKVIGQHAKYQIIPRRLKISKRLAQCMHPHLPFGVHLKALETYDLIFKSMGTNRLSHELFIYSAGLFPLFGYCAMKVRPDLLKIYETHFVPLGIRLRPALPGFLSGVLPGFEESSDHFARTNQLLETICEGVGPTNFYGCLWDCIASNSNVRLPALAFVLSHFDKKKTTEDQPHIMGTDIETMVCGLIACVQDANIFVQRSALDLLILGFPLYNSHLTIDDMIRLVTAAVSTIPRRDQSLNRRIFAWLLGLEVNMTLLAHYPQIIQAKAENKLLTYFEVFSRAMLVKALTIILDNAIGVRPFDLRPYQLLISLLDKDGLGPAILDDILLEYFRLLYLSYNFDLKADVSELLSEANFLFSSVEQKFLWNYIGHLFVKACSRPCSTCLDVENPVRRVASGEAGVVEICTLTDFLLDKVSAFDASPDTHSQHLPTLFLQIVTVLSSNCDKLTPMQIVQALNLCSKILNRVQPLIVGHRNDNDDSSDSEPSDSSTLNSSSNYQFESAPSEPVQNADCSSIDERVELPRDDVEPTIEKTDSLLEQCMRQYEHFYVNFIYSLRTRMGERREVSELLEALNRGSNNNEETAKRYENLLDDVLQRTASALLPDQKRSSNPFGREWVEPVKKASRLLVDLSTLKTFLRAPAYPRGLLESERHVEDTVIESLPEWLCVLMTCSCWFNKSSYLQITSIAAILDLVTLCTTAQSLASNSAADDGATTILIRPLLTPCHLKYMEKNTFIFEAMCHWLWQQLDLTDHKVQSVELLHQLHSAFPFSGTVETCIGVYLEPHQEKVQSQVSRLESFRKFSALWNIGREINSRQGNSLRVSDIFYKSMLKMLDNFKLPGCDSLKTEAQEWLLHSLLRGDIHRILDPILFMLLDPSTARISVLHIRINSDNASDTASLQSAAPEDQSVPASSSSDSKAPNPVKSKGNKGQSKGKTGGFLLSAIAAAIASPPVQHKQKFSTELKDGEGTNDRAVSLNINSLTSEPSSVNTDFDEFFEEVTDKSAEGSSKTQPSQHVVRNRSFPSLDKEAGHGSLGINEAFRNTSIDLLSLSDSIMTKISDGELPFNRFNLGSLSSDRISHMLPSQDCGDFVKSWSFPSKEADGSDLEESAAADEYFSSDKDSLSVVDDLMSEVLDTISDQTTNSENKKEPSPEFKPRHRKLQYQPSVTSHPSDIDSLHAHMLLYKNRYDVETILYCLETLRNILVQQPRAFLVASSTTRLVSRSPILKLLARHKKSLFGRGFSGELEESNIRSAMYLEVMMMVCLYYIRSYYPEPSSSAQRDVDNKGAQISSAEVLTLLCTELIRIVREGSRNLALNLSDLLSRLKVYKIILHSVLTNINQWKTSSQPLTHQILKFNNVLDLPSERLSHPSEALIKQQIKLLLSLIILEHEVLKVKGDLPSNIIDRQPDVSELKYINGRLIPQQPLFIQAVHKALENQPAMRYIHSQWTSLITCSLPFMGNALSRVVTTALKQICANIEASSECYSSTCSLSFPPDYGVVLMEALTIMCHYCLLDTSSTVPSLNSGSDDTSNLQVFKDLTHLFMPALTPSDHKERSEGKSIAKKAVLGHLPRVIASISTLWHSLVNRKDRESANCEVGSPLVMKQKIIEFLSPLAVQHASSFLAAMAVVWRERSQPLTASTANLVLPEACENQKVLVQLLIGIKAMPIHVLVQTLHQVVKQPTLNQESAITVEISALELFVNYVQHVPAPSLLDSWPSLLQLFKDAPTLSPPALFLMMGTLSHLVHRCTFNDKKDIKDLQEVTVKLIEACTTIVGACLEQTTWIRKNFAVRDEDPTVTLDKEDKENDLVVSETPTTSEGKTKKSTKSERKRNVRKNRQDAEKLQVRTMHQWFLRAFVNDSILPLDFTDKHKSGSNSLAQYSINALNVLAHLLAPLLDTTFGSQEKERVVTILNNLMVNVVPYLKNHTLRNAASYYSCSQLVASITSYQYTRKAWKKDVIELMFDPSFFQMESRSLKSWKIITDNLISQEISTFRDFMSRVNVPQGSSFGIFNSREAEYEQRAQLLKRLAFVIYCSEVDQFANNMPEFQEKLAESTKIPHNGVLAQVFLCFRVMLLRMTPSIIIPLWPTIISEILQVMTLMERELSSEFENYSSNVRALMATDWNWVTNNGSNSQALWLQLQLAAASLLFLAVQLPADRLPQFQMYRWAFVGGDSVANSRGPISVTPDFVPHVVKIAELMDAKFGTMEALPTPLLPSAAQLSTAEELHPFFCAMRSGKYTPLTVTQLEHQLELDILDSMSLR